MKANHSNYRFAVCSFGFHSSSSFSFLFPWLLMFWYTLCVFKLPISKMAFDSRNKSARILITLIYFKSFCLFFLVLYIFALNDQMQMLIIHLENNKRLFITGIENCLYRNSSVENALESLTETMMKYKNGSRYAWNMMKFHRKNHARFHNRPKQILIEYN